MNHKSPRRTGRRALTDAEIATLYDLVPSSIILV